MINISDEATDTFTAEYLYKALQLTKKLESSIVKHRLRHSLSFEISTRFKEMVQRILANLRELNKRNA